MGGELHTRLLSQFANASSIIQRLQVIQGSKNYGALKCIQGIEDAVLAKQLNSLQTILLSMNKTFSLQQRIGIKPSLADCLDGLTILSEMHQSEYRLKIVSVFTDDLSVLQQLLVDQPNIPKDEVNLAEKMVDLGTLKTATMDDDAQTRTWITWDLGMIPSDEIYSFACSGEMFELESLHILWLDNYTRKGSKDDNEDAPNQNRDACMHLC
nr:uncharacterized protein At5g43822-like [Ipomoea batatas]